MERAVAATLEEAWEMARVEAAARVAARLAAAVTAMEAAGVLRCPAPLATARKPAGARPTAVRTAAAFRRQPPMGERLLYWVELYCTAVPRPKNTAHSRRSLLPCC